MQTIEQAAMQCGIDLDCVNEAIVLFRIVLELVNAFPEPQRAGVMTAVAHALQGPEDGRAARVVALLTPVGGAA